MSLDRSLSEYREAYMEASSDFVLAIDEAFEAAQRVLKEAGFRVANDDHAENLVTAIVKYVVISSGKPLDENQLKLPKKK